MNRYLAFALRVAVTVAIAACGFGAGVLLSVRLDGRTTIGLFIVLIVTGLAIARWGQLTGWGDQMRAAEDQALRVADKCGPDTPCSFEDNYLCVYHRSAPHAYVSALHCDRCYAAFEEHESWREFVAAHQLGEESTQ